MPGSDRAALARLDRGGLLPRLSRFQLLSHRLAVVPVNPIEERPTEQSVAALSTVQTTVTFDRPGTYRYVCHMPGHERYGMVGFITVTGG